MKIIELKNGSFIKVTPETDLCLNPTKLEVGGVRQCTEYFVHKDKDGTSTLYGRHTSLYHNESRGYFFVSLSECDTQDEVMGMRYDLCLNLGQDYVDILKNNGIHYADQFDMSDEDKMYATKDNKSERF